MSEKQKEEPDFLVTVSGSALRAVLEALNGPRHHISELVVVHELEKRSKEPNDPIGILRAEFDKGVDEYNSKYAQENSNERKERTPESHRRAD